MGSFQRNKSNHWIDIKGKGILYDEDDEPIKLTDQDTSQNIIEFQLSDRQDSQPKETKCLKASSENAITMGLGGPHYR